MTQRLFVAAATAALLAPLTRAQTLLTLTPDKDAGLYFSATGDVANGGGTAMFSGTTGQPAVRRALLRFDVAGALPAGAILVAAELELTVQASSSPAAMDYDAHRVLADWSEGPTVAPGGQGAGAPAQAGDVTWLHTDFPNGLWATPGGDFAAAPSFSSSLPASGPATSGFADGLLADVAAWRANPAANFGWVLIGDEVNASTSTKIATRESNTPPQLHVWYVTPGQTGAWGTGTTIGGATVQLAASGTPSAGATVSFAYTAAPASQLGATFYSIDLAPGGVTLATDRTALLDLGAPLVPGALFTTDTAGAATATLTVPSGGLGYVICAQGAVLDGSPFGVALSNAALVAPL